MINDRIYTTYTKIKNHPASLYLLLAAITLLAAALRFYKLRRMEFLDRRILLCQPGHQPLRQPRTSFSEYTTGPILDPNFNDIDGAGF
jgi:hypothetical protein